VNLNHSDGNTVRSRGTPVTRRDVLGAGALAGGALLLGGRTAAAQPGPPPPGKDFKFEEENPARNNVPAPQTPLPPGEPGTHYTPVVAPNGWTLPYKLIDGVKVFHLVAEEVEQEFAPGLKATCWGYNGGVHGPVIEVVEGDRVRIFVTNRLAALTTVHWHGVLLPSGMDGVGGLTQKAIVPGETYMYEFTLRQHGTLMYHSHHDEMTQMGLGMTGMIVVHPRTPTGPRPDRDFVLLVHEWKIEPGASRPDPNEMTDFNILTFNAKCFPGTQPLIVRQGDRVRVRIGNLGAMDHHPIHLHGYYFTVTETDGGVIPEAGRWPETTVLVPVGSTRTIEFTADNPGDWAMHCHMTHHVMNQMGHHMPNMIGVDARGLDTAVRKLLPGYMTMGQDGMAGMTEMGMPIPPNSIPMVGGVGPYDEITMGGMFTILKVRENLTNYDEDPGWYQTPAGTLSVAAPAAVLERHGIDADGSSAPRAPAAAIKPWRLPPPLEPAEPTGEPPIPPGDKHGAHK
jgi:FtsP/CotA-like multicopper oxidase with cupredoxin domain